MPFQNIYKNYITVEEKEKRIFHILSILEFMEITLYNQ